MLYMTVHSCITSIYMFVVMYSDQAVKNIITFRRLHYNNRPTFAGKSRALQVAEVSDSGTVSKFFTCVTFHTGRTVLV